MSTENKEALYRLVILVWVVTLLISLWLDALKDGQSGIADAAPQEVTEFTSIDDGRYTASLSNAQSDSDVFVLYQYENGDFLVPLLTSSGEYSVFTVQGDQVHQYVGGTSAYAEFNCQASNKHGTWYLSGVELHIPLNSVVITIPDNSNVQYTFDKAEKHKM